MSDENYELGLQIGELKGLLTEGFKGIKIDIQELVSHDDKQDVKIQSICDRLKTMNGIETGKRSTLAGIKGYLMLALIFIGTLATIWAAVIK